MQFNRRTLLTGVSTATLYLLMPFSSAVPLDRQALGYIARHVRTNLLEERPEDQNTIFSYLLRRGCPASRDEWLSEAHVAGAVDRTLRFTFRALSIAAQDGEYHFPLMQGSKLTVWGQTVAMYLPLAPDRNTKGLFAALDRVAPHYLS